MITYDEAIQHIKENPRPGRNDAPMEVSASGGRHRYVWLMADDVDTVDVTLFDSCIAQIHADGSYTVDSCGYATPTTRDALNAVLGQCSVGSEKGLWWFRGTHPFRDGMTIRLDPPRVSYTGADAEQVVFDDPRKR